MNKKFPGRLKQYTMTQQLAFEIAEVKSRATWRRLSEIMSERYPDTDFGDGNQLYGMDLDKEALKVLKDVFRDMNDQDRAIYLTSPNQVLRKLSEGGWKKDYYYLDDYEEETCGEV